MSREEKAAYFRLLGSLLYNEPDAAAMDMLLDDEIFSELPYAGDNALAREGQAQITAWLGSGSKAELLDKTNSDFMRLFIGPDKLLAAPWGSVYLDEDRLLFNEDTLKVRKFYERYGMMTKKKYSEPDDHIGLELEFLAHLAEQGNDEAMAGFAREFMLPWILRWNDDVRKYARTGYYRGLAGMAAGGVEYLCDVK